MHVLKIKLLRDEMTESISNLRNTWLKCLLVSIEITSWWFISSANRQRNWQYKYKDDEVATKKLSNEMNIALNVKASHLLQGTKNNFIWFINN